MVMVKKSRAGVRDSTCSSARLSSWNPESLQSSLSMVRAEELFLKDVRFGIGGFLI
jgi:hypothetical protein